MLSNFTKAGQSRSIIFPKGPNADGWFTVALIEANKSLSWKKHSTPRFGSLKVSGHPSFANVIRGGSGILKNSALKG